MREHVETKGQAYSFPTVKSRPAFKHTNVVPFKMRAFFLQDLSVGLKTQRTHVRTR